MNPRFARAFSFPFIALLLVGLPTGAILFASCSGAKAGSSEPAAALRERGRYLVEQVGLCADCHTPRDEQGRLQMDRHLLGAALPFQPKVPMPWADVAPLTRARAMRASMAATGCFSVRAFSFQSSTGSFSMATRAA